MSQTYTDDCYASGHQAATDLQAYKDNFAALKSAFSGTSAPSNPVAGMWWFDTTNNLMKLRNEANDAWRSVWDIANNKPVIANLSAEITTAMITAGNITHALLDDDAVETANIKDGAVTLAKCSFGGSGTVSPISGDNVGIAGGPTERTTTSTSYIEKKSATVSFAGTYKVSYLIKTNGWQGGSAKVYVDDVAYGSEHIAATDYAAPTPADIVTITAGQKISVYLKAVSGYTAYIKNFIITCDNNPFMVSAVTD